MGMFMALMLAAIAVTRLFPDTGTGRFLHRWLAEKPAAWLATIERKHVIFLALAALLVVVLREAVPMVAGAGDLALFAMWDASVYLDVVMAAWTIAALARGRSGWAVVRHRLGQLVARRRPRAARPRARRTRAVRPVANDDDGDGWALAA
ncbi:MAG: putative rane protein [Sphingomonas bacterium]|nr:putative rane protein [Sphingomonas bacterium]